MIQDGTISSSQMFVSTVTDIADRRQTRRLLMRENTQEKQE